MTPLKTIIATAVIAVGATVAAFSGLHIGQTNADATTANQAAKAKTTYSVTLTAKQLATLMHGQKSGATQRVRHQQRHAQRHAVRYQNNGSSSGRSYSGSFGSYGSSSYSGQSGYRCYGNGGSHSGSYGGSSHSGSGWGGGCW